MFAKFKKKKKKVLCDSNCIFPAEILLHIFSYLTTFEDLVSLSFVCTDFYSVSREKILWDNLLGDKYIRSLSYNEKNQSSKYIYLNWIKESLLQDKKHKHVYQKVPACFLKCNEKWIANSRYKNFDYKLPVLLIGDYNVGKTSIFSQFVEEKFDDYMAHSKNIDVPFQQNKTLRVVVTDPYGIRFHNQRVPYRRKFAFVVIFDVTDGESFSNVPIWLEEIEKYSYANCIKLLVANKCDTDRYQRKVLEQEVLEFAKSTEIPYLEVSAMTGENIDLIVPSLITMVQGNWPLGVIPYNHPKYVPTRAALENLGILKLSPPIESYCEGEQVNTTSSDVVPSVDETTTNKKTCSCQ